jgi:hypothetical protein
LGGGLKFFTLSCGDWFIVCLFVRVDMVCAKA